MTEKPEQKNIELCDLWYNKGVSFSDSKEYEKALMAYDQALSFNDKDPDVWNNKCSILTKLGRYDEAIKAGNIAVELEPNDPVLWDTLHAAYIGSNNQEKAEECSKKISDIKKSFLNENNEIKFYFWKMHPIAIIISIIYVFLAILGSLPLDNLSFTSLPSSLKFTVIILGIGYICGEYAAKKWAPRINGSQSWAFMIPFLTNLLGLFIYWIYYYSQPPQPFTATPSRYPAQPSRIRLCRSCGNQIKPGDKFCSKCLAKVVDDSPAATQVQYQPPAPQVQPLTPPASLQVCASCGSPITGTEKFCGICGTPVSSTPPASSAKPKSPLL